MQNANLLNLPENYTFKYCESAKAHPVSAGQVTLPRANSKRLRPIS